ncbi:MAG: hypothetical protein ACWA41_08250 [Putridiphycobacter sp.]
MAEVPMPIFLKNHLTDLLCMPIVLTICLWGIRTLKKRPNFMLTIPMILSMSLFYAWFFEFFAPQYYPAQTGDKIDAIMYLIGGGLYWFFQNHLRKSKVIVS